MLPWRRHPDGAAFTRFIDGEGTDDEAEAIENHLGNCSRCRASLKFFEEVQRAAGELAHPTPPPELLDKILARRAAGERVILPTSAPPFEENVSDSSTPVTVLASLALFLAGSLALFFLTSGEAGAGTSTLEWLPALPRTGQRLSFEFRAASPLAAEEHLRLRAWYRTSNEPPPRKLLGTYVEGQLKRRKGGRFEGELWLPPGAVYAMFVVEDPEATRVEGNGDRLWEVRAHDENGRPLFEALREEFRVKEFRQTSDALATAQRMTKLYPGRAQGWFFRFLYERLLLPERTDSLRSAHKSVLSTLHRQLWDRTDLPSTEVAAIVHYAEALGEHELAHQWTQRLNEEHPHTRTAVTARVLQLLHIHRQAPENLLQALESEWLRSGPVSEFLAERGFSTAVATGRVAAVDRWATRYLDFRPDLSGFIAKEMSSIPPLRDRAAELLRQELRSLSVLDPGSRLPTLDRRQQQAANGRKARSLLAVLGAILVSQEATEAALDTLSLAAAGGWDPDLFQRLARTRIQAGDTAAAIELAAWTSVDPVAPTNAEAVLGAEITSRIKRSRWYALKELARQHLRERVLAEATLSHFPASADVLLENGETESIASLIEERPTLLIYCSLLAPACRRDLPALERFASELKAGGSHVLLVLADARSSSNPFAEYGAGSIPVVIDTEGSVARELDRWTSPQYAVLDERGLIRFHHANLKDAVRQLLVLRG